MSRASAAQLALFTEMTGRAQALADWQARFERHRNPRHAGR